MPRCKYLNKACVNMTVLNGVAYCDSVPCSIKDEFPKLTNADRIRSMSVEELAEFLFKVNCAYAEPCMIGGTDCFKEWLESEVEE